MQSVQYNPHNGIAEVCDLIGRDWEYDLGEDGSVLTVTRGDEKIEIPKLKFVNRVGDEIKLSDTPIEEESS